MKMFLPIALIIVVLSSGCTIPGIGDIPGLSSISSLFGGGQVIQYEHDILVIKSLEAIPSEIDAGQNTRIIAYVQNVGDNVIPQNGVTGSIEIELYDYCKGLFTPKVTTCGSDGAIEGNAKCKLDKILPGEIVPVAWTLEQDTGTEIPLRTICPPDGVKVLVKYPYRTNALTTISFITDEELDRSLEQREYWQVGDYIVSGQGPLKPFITVEDKQPIPVFEDARTVVALQFKNMGTGYPLTDDTNKIEYTISGLSENGLKTDSVECAVQSGTEDVRIIGKESQKFICKLDVSGIDDGLLKRGTRVLEATATYTYIFTKSVLVTINPKIAQ